MPWTAPEGVLGELVARAERDASERATKPLSAPTVSASSRGFVQAIREYKNGFPLICEVKRASPSANTIVEGAKATDVARVYEQGGACCVSVLTESSRFNGSLQDLSEVSNAVAVPTLRKDFIVDPFMVEEAANAGARCVLLIAAAVEPKKLLDLADIASGLGLDVLLEIIYERDLEALALRNWNLVGVNARDLATLTIDRNRFATLAPKIADDSRLLVAESAVTDAEDVERYRDAGANAVLVGETLMRASEPAAVIRSLRLLPEDRA